MNFKPKKTIFRMVHGSHLFGTTTESSDTDYKEIFLPSGESILLGEAVDAYEILPENKVKTEKNKAGDVDTQAFSLKKLSSMLVGGDIIGCEMIFANQNVIEFIDPIYEDVIKNRGIFLSKIVKGYVGYCQRQAAKYGIRGSRVAACRAAYGLFHNLSLNSAGSAARIGVYSNSVEEFAAKTEHCSIETKTNPQTGAEMKYFVCCDRMMGYTDTVWNAAALYKKIFDNYGQRALAAETNNGVDWKAMSHSIRVGNQAVELLTTGNITFPRPEAEYLLAIKQGKIDYKIVGEQLEDLLEQVTTVKTVLPDKPDFEAIKNLKLKWYRTQID